MIGMFHTLLRDRRGSVTVELALFAPILATLVVGIADISIAFGRKLELEQASQRAIEKVMQTTGSSTVADTIKIEAVCQVNGPAEPSEEPADGDGEEASPCAVGRITASDVTVGYLLECVDESGTRTSSEASDAAAFDALTCNAGDRDARYLSVTVVDTYTPMFPISWGAGPDGVYSLSATAGVRTK